MNLYDVLEHVRFRAIAGALYRVRVVGSDRIPASGAARLALATGAPIVPVRLVDTRGFPHPGRAPVQIVVGEPIVVEPAKPTVAAAKDLTRRVEQTLVEDAA